MPDIRAFVALSLEAGIQRRLHKAISDLREAMPDHTVKWVEAEHIHITLKFLGDVPQTRLEAVTEALRRAALASAPFPFQVGGLGCFPNVRRPSVIWVGVNEPAGALASLQLAVEQELERLGFLPEERAFSPHLTLGRVRREISPADLRAVGRILDLAKVGALGSQPVEAMHLFRSDLRPAGPIYTALASIPLKEI